MLINILLVSLGGALGATLRFTISPQIDKLFNSNFPFGIFVVNIIGCFFIGFFLGSYIPSRDATFYFFVIGFLGSFTTMSAFAHQVILMADSNIIGAVSYIMLTVILTILATYIGASFTK